MLNPETAFRDAKKTGDGWMAKCPGHDDGKSSLKIDLGKDGKILLKCFAGCDVDRILSAAGLTKADLFPRRPATKKKITATYEYRDEGGQHLYDVCRFDPKDFRQRRADGVWSMDSVRRVVYHLDKLQGETTVYIPEGEKDADRLRTIGLPATCNVGGAGKWREGYTAQLKAAAVQRVVILPDNDEPGRQHAAEVARSCHAAGLEVKVVALPDMPSKGDVSDWLDSGHTKADLVSLVKATPLYAPSAASAVPSEPVSVSNPVVLVDAAQLLVSLITFIRRFVVVTDHQGVAISMWIAHTHVIDAFDCTPYLQITSATKRAGKTRLLEVLEPLVAHPWLTGRTSAAALVRKVDAESPTLLLDETDAAFGGERDYAEALRGILNSGYRRSGKATVCVGQGTKIEARDFSTFCPKAIAGIGRLPDTVADRSIAIELRRKHTDERCERWRERDGHAEAAPLREQLATWAASAREALRGARPALPGSLGDRQADVWESLLAIADRAGDDWPDRARRAAIALTGVVEDQDVNVDLLHDINTVFTDVGSAFIASKQLAEKLAEMDERPWSAWSHGKPITPRAIADRLKSFGIFPCQNVTRTARGYERDRFLDAWSRYPAIKPSNRPNPNDYGDESPIPNRPLTPTPDTSTTQETPIDTGLSDTWTLQSGETGTERAGGSAEVGSHVEL